MTRISRVLIASGILLCGQFSPAGAFDEWKAAREAFIGDPSLVAYYDFQEKEGVTLKNFSVHGACLDGEIHNAERVQGRWPGKGAVSFDGRSSYIKIPDHPSLTPTADGGEWTILVWLKRDAYKQAGIVDKTSRGWGRDSPYYIWANPYSGGFGGDGETGSSQSVSSGGWAEWERAAERSWEQVVLSVTSGAITLYRNGTAIGDRARSRNPGSNGRPLLIGAMNHEDESGRFHFSGIIDEAAIFSRAMTPEEINANWMRLSGLYIEEEPVTIHNPLPGAELSAGSYHRIIWNYPDVSARMKIEYSTDGGRSWSVIAERAPNEPVEGLAVHMRLNSSYLWKVPGTVSDRCRIRISPANGRVGAAATEGNFSITPSAASSYEWTQVTPSAAFPARDGAGALVYRDRMWLLGGWNPGDKVNFPRICNNEVWSSADGASWELVKANSFIDEEFDSEADWEGRHSAGYVVYDGYMWIVGGDGNQGHYQPDVWKSRDGRSWELVTAKAPWGERILHHTAVFNGNIWVMGGQTGPSFPARDMAFYNDVWRSADGVNWTLAAENAAWTHRGMICGYTVFNGKIWLIGGGTYNMHGRARLYFPEVWNSPDGVNWEIRQAYAPWAPRSYHNVEVYDGRMWVLAGSNSAYLDGDRNDVWYSSDGVNWYELENTPWRARHAASVFVHEGKLWMAAGAPGRNERSVWKLSPGGD